MSLARLVYYSAIIGGWAAFVAWAVAEFTIWGQGSGGSVQVALIGAVVGAAIGAGLNMVAGMANAHWKQLLLRLIPGLLGGGLGGLVGGFLGNVLFSAIGLPRAIGWMIMGLGIGAVEGLYEHSPSKLRNGLLGGGLGGLVGGFLFDPITKMIASGSGMSSRATAFVILGLCIGALIGFVQVVLKEAWLTVLDGYRVGRQLILSQPVTVLGRGDHVPLPFLGPTNTELSTEHLRILRQTNGSFVLEDNKSKLGTRLNGQIIQGPMTLQDADLIKLGTNIVRFNVRHGKSGATPQAAPAGFTGTIPLAPPPPKIVRKETVPIGGSVETSGPRPAAAAPPPATSAAPPVSKAAPPPLPPPLPAVGKPIPAAPPPARIPAPPPPKPVLPSSAGPSGAGSQTIRPIPPAPPPPKRTPGA